MIIHTRTYGNVTRSFNRADWTGADINFYVQHILPQEVQDDQQSWDEACDSIVIHEGFDALADYQRLNPRPQLAEDHPLPDQSSYAMSPCEEATEACFAVAQYG